MTSERARDRARRHPPPVVPTSTFIQGIERQDADRRLDPRRPPPPPRKPPRIHPSTQPPVPPAQPPHRPRKSAMEAEIQKQRIMPRTCGKIDRSRPHTQPTFNVPYLICREQKNEQTALARVPRSPFPFLPFSFGVPFALLSVLLARRARVTSHASAYTNHTSHGIYLCSTAGVGGLGRHRKTALSNLVGENWPIRFLTCSCMA